MRSKLNAKAVLKYIFLVLVTLSLCFNGFILISGYLRSISQRGWDAAILSIVEKSKTGPVTIVLPDKSGTPRKYELELKQETK